jgi:acyl carrier protein
MPRDVRRELVAIFADIFQIDLDPHVEDLGAGDIAAWDSVNKMRLLMEIEQVFGVSISDEEAIELASLRQAEALLRKRGIGRLV